MEASNVNYIYNGKNKYTFIEAIDPKWQGALPYTILIEPGGKIVYGKQGPIDPLQLKKQSLTVNILAVTINFPTVRMGKSPKYETPHWFYDF